MLNRVESVWRLLKSVDLEVLIKSHLHWHIEIYWIYPFAFD